MEVQIEPGYAVHYAGYHIFVSNMLGKKAIELGAIEPATDKLDCKGEGCWQFTDKTNQHD